MKVLDTCRFPTEWNLKFIDFYMQKYSVQFVWISRSLDGIIWNNHVNVEYSLTNTQFMLSVFFSQTHTHCVLHTNHKRRESDWCQWVCVCVLLTEIWANVIDRGRTLLAHNIVLCWLIQQTDTFIGKRLRQQDDYCAVLIKNKFTHFIQQLSHFNSKKIEKFNLKLAWIWRRKQVSWYHFPTNTVSTNERRIQKINIGNYDEIIKLNWNVFYFL